MRIIVHVSISEYEAEKACVSIVKPALLHRVNLAKGSMALQEFLTLDPIALASFCESALCLFRQTSMVECLK